MSREAMKLALEALEEITDEVFSPYDNKLGKAITALREALAEQPAQQEPVYVYTCKGCQSLFWENCVSCDCTVDGLMEFDRHVLSGSTSPPAQRAWVGLSDEERKLVRNSVGYNQFVTAGEYAEHVQKATEFKLREKNT